MRQEPRGPQIRVLAPLAAGCTLHPLYAGGGRGPVAQALHGVQVAPIQGRSGWLVRTALEDRLERQGTPVYRLEAAIASALLTGSAPKCAVVTHFKVGLTP